MYKSALLTTILMASAFSPALAQEAPYSQTLDEQYLRVQNGQSAVPMNEMSPSAGTLTSYTPTVAYDRHGQPIQSHGSGAIPPLPLEIMASGEIYYITGGVGDEEEAQLKSVEQDYNLRLLMTGINGEYISDATIRIRDAGGKDIAMATDAGPYFYARIKPGQYVVAIDTVGSGSKSVDVTVPSSGAVKQQVRF